MRNKTHYQGFTEFKMHKNREFRAMSNHDKENDDVIILSTEDDDDKTVFQSEEDRKKLEQEILGLNDESSLFDLDADTTMQMTIEPSPYWKRIFG